MTDIVERLRRLIVLSDYPGLVRHFNDAITEIETLRAENAALVRAKLQQEIEANKHGDTIRYYGGHKP